MRLERSEGAKRAKSVFYRDFNDVDVYVEDTSKGTQKLYKIIIQRALGGAYSVDAVFPLGGKEAVVRNCEEDQDEGGRPRLYIIDGDLNLMLDGNPKHLRRLLVLSRYCIENYLIDEDALLSILDQEDIERSRDELQAAFDFENWREANEESLYRLFILYAIAYRWHPGLESVSFPINKLVVDDTGFINSERLAARMEQVEADLLVVMSEEDLTNRKDMIHRHCRDLGMPGFCFVSGKDYLLPLVNLRLRNTTKIRADNLVIKQRLAMFCDVSELSNIGTLLSGESLQNTV